MILEVAILNVRTGQGDEFASVFRQASPLIASIPGYVSHELQKCVETPERYLLLVHWQTLEAHRWDSGNRRRTRSGRRCCTIFTTPFPWLSITRRC